MVAISNNIDCCKEVCCEHFHEFALLGGGCVL